MMPISSRVACPCVVSPAGALHVHALLWVQGLDPATLQRCVDDEAAVRAVSQRLDAMVMQSLDPAVVQACNESVSSQYDLFGSKGIDNAASRAIGSAEAGAASHAGASPDTDSVRAHVAPAPSHLGFNWRQYLAPLPPGAPVTASDSALRLDARQYDAYLTYVILAVGVHSHSKTCHKGGRGEECCRLAYPAGCWDTLPAPVELLRAPGDKTVIALRALTPHAVANPPGEHNPWFPLARPDSRVITWELFRPSAGVNREQARGELDAYLARCKDKVAAAAEAAAGDDDPLLGYATEGWQARMGAALRAAPPEVLRAMEEWEPGDPEVEIPGMQPTPDDERRELMERQERQRQRQAHAPPYPTASEAFPQGSQGPSQLVVPQCRAITGCVRCNSSINLLLAQDASRCASFYLAKYVCA